MGYPCLCWGFFFSFGTQFSWDKNPKEKHICLKDQRLTAKTNTGICQLNPETKYFLSTNEMEGLLSPQI